MYQTLAYALLATLVGVVVFIARARLVADGAWD